jgi:protein involved in polysaccharide export with SLBB domain
MTFGAVAMLVMPFSTAAAQPRPRSSADGIIRVGDRIVLKVDGETQLSDTFTVSAGPALVLPVVGSIPLVSVRREDIERQLTAEIAKFIRSPSVRAHVLLRLAVLGEVARPGFYVLPIDALVNDALMLAGGPTKDAKIETLRIQRTGQTTWPPDSLRIAMAQGLTFAQLDVQPEDVLFMPKALSVGNIWPIVLTILTTAVTIYSVTHINKK